MCVSRQSRHFAICTMVASVEELVQVLQATLSPDVATREQAEAYLKQHDYAKGYIVGLMQVATAPQADGGIRQAAAIHLKNISAKGWEPKREESPRLHEEDKATIRANILESFIQSPELIRSQLTEVMRVAVQHDFPERWPDLLTTLMGHLGTDDIARVYGAVQVIQVICRKYEFRDKDERTVLTPVIENAFPRLLQMLQSLIANEAQRNDKTLAALVKLILKTYWSATYLELPPALMRADVFGAWITCLHQMIGMQVPTEGQPADRTERKNFPWWKAKKWSLHIANRMFSRYGNPKQTKPEYKEFAKTFKDQVSCVFLQSYMQLLGNLSGGGYLPDRIVNLALQYLSTALSHSNTYKLMKPHMETLMFNVVFPIVCFNQIDAELWEEDPQEYIRRGNDIIEEMYSPRAAAINFLVEVCRCRTKENMPKLMGFIVQIFTRCLEMGPNAPHPELGGALHCIGSLQEKLKTTDGYKEQLEPMLVQHVLPSFQSQHGHVRAKAAWCAGVYAEIEFANPQNFMNLFAAVVNCLKDPDLPVKVDAVVSLGSYVETADDISQIRPILPQLLDEFFALMNEVESEEMVFTLETIVEKFGEEIAPYAMGMTANLAAAFWKLTGSADQADDEDFTGALASVGCLRAIATILESLSALPHMYEQLEPNLMPIMRKMLGPDGYDVYEEVLEIQSYMTYYSPAVSPAMWELWPVLIASLEGEYGVQYFENILVPMDNYISRGTETFLAHPNCKNDVLRVASGVLLNNQIPEPEVLPAPKLLECVLQNCKGRVDDCVAPYLAVALERLKTCELTYLKDLLVQIVANCLWYDASLTLDILVKNGALGTALQTWFAMLNDRTRGGDKRRHHRREHDKKVCILGLVALIQTPEPNLPAEVAAGMGQICSAVVSLLVDLRTQEKERKEFEAKNPGGFYGHGWGSDDDDFGGDEDLGEDDEDDEEPVLDSAELAAMAKRAQSVNPFRRRGGDDEDDDDDEDFDDGMLTDDENFTSPIDDIDPFTLFAETVTVVQSADAGRFQALAGGLDAAGQQTMQELVAYAGVRREELAKEKAEDEAKKAAAQAKAGPGAIPVQRAGHENH